MTNEIKDSINTYSFDDDIIEAGMLSSPQIAYCQEKYKIIEGYDESCLGSATYHMRIGGLVRAWEDGKSIEFTLAESDDQLKKMRSLIELQPNSLTYVTTIEEFNLSKDIIARYNLKSKWVHKGLLLGTGPIVDPEFHGQLLIPLHNFSSQPVPLRYKDKLISVEFTKTLNPQPNNSDKKNQKNQIKRAKIEHKYKENTSRSFDLRKFIERGGAEPQSSVLNKFDQFDKKIVEFNNQMKQQREKHDKLIFRFNIGSAISVLVVVISLLTLGVTTWSLISSTFEQLNDAKNIVKQYKSQNVDYNAFVLKKDYDELKNQFSQLKKDTERLNTSIYIEKQTQPVDIKNVIDSVDNSFEKIEEQIVGLEKEIQRIKEQKE